ncbi:MAG: transposase [Chamaesiphon sp.]|nr:transposase [Chamaesiphon sp.]
MSKRKQQQPTEEIFTQVIPVVFCGDEAQISQIAQLCGTPRSITYNKLGSLCGWNLDWKKADPIIRTVLTPGGIGLPAKLWEWSVNDAIKAIIAQQEAAKTFIVRAIYQRVKDDLERKRLIELLNTDPTSNNWLHRQFRKYYQRGHTFVRNQIVYQNAGYSARRLTRNTIELQVAGLAKGKRITLKLKCRHVVSGQIRLIRNEYGQLEVHCIRKRTVTKRVANPSESIGLDKGYTEAFFTSNGDEIGAGLGQMMTEKTKRITRTNRNRYRLRSYAAKRAFGGKLPPKTSRNNPDKAAAILANNLGYKVKSRRLAKEKATIKNFIRKDLRRVITSPTQICAEDLTSPIKNKHESKALNRKLNQWMKGELQASLEVISKETGSTLSVVNPAYTSQTCSQTGTLLGQRNGDRFTCYTGVVEQADKNAAKNILHRGSDDEIARYQKYAEVRKTLILRTVRYLVSIGTTVTEALKLGWLNSKFRAEAMRCEAEISPTGVVGTGKHSLVGESAKIRQRAQPQPSEMIPAILDKPVQLTLDFDLA